MDKTYDKILKGYLELFFKKSLGMIPIFSSINEVFLSSLGTSSGRSNSLNKTISFIAKKDIHHSPTPGKIVQRNCQNLSSKKTNLTGD